MYLILSLLIDLLSRYWGYASEPGYNLVLLPIYAFLELSIFSVLYYAFFFKRKRRKILYIMILGQALIIADFMLMSNVLVASDSQSFAKVIADGIIVSYCLMYYWELIKSEVLIHNPLIPINSSILFYFTVNFMIFLPVNFLVNGNVDLVIYFWSVNLVVTLVFYTYMIYLLWENGKAPRQLPDG